MKKIKNKKNNWDKKIIVNKWSTHSTKELIDKNSSLTTQLLNHHITHRKNQIESNLGLDEGEKVSERNRISDDCVIVLMSFDLIIMLIDCLIVLYCSVLFLTIVLLAFLLACSI